MYKLKLTKEEEDKIIKLMKEDFTAHPLDEETKKIVRR